MRADENTYFIDPSSEAELARLIKMDSLMNKYTSLLPKEFVPWKDARVLDLACGPGGWALELADRFPLVKVVGIDIDPLMIAYARAQAQVREQDRVEFIEGNILNPLDFSPASFDFINARFLGGLMHTSFWKPLIQECFRLSCPGGIIRMTETGARIAVGSPSADRFDLLLMRAFWKTGMIFSERGPYITPMLGMFLAEQGYQVLKEVPYLINLSFGTEFQPVWLPSARVALQLIKPFLLKHIDDIDEEELENVCQAAMQEMSTEGYREHWFVISVIAQKGQ